MLRQLNDIAKDAEAAREPNRPHGPDWIIRLRIYGSGIASSYTESVFALDDPSPNRIRFAVERVMRTNYRIDDFQETYFVLRSLDDLLELAHIDFGPLYDRLRALPAFEPGDVLPSDAVIARGTGRHHRDQRHGH
jgi:phenylalanine-4-hydroxylase